MKSGRILVLLLILFTWGCFDKTHEEAVDIEYGADIEQADHPEISTAESSGSSSKIRKCLCNGEIIYTTDECPCEQDPELTEAFIRKKTKRTRPKLLTKKDKVNLAVKTDSYDYKHFSNNGNGTVIDRKTGLMWADTDSYGTLKKGLSFVQAKHYAQALNTAGYKDWRVPTIDELRTLVDKDSKILAHDRQPQTPLRLPPVFAIGGGYWAWSSEEYDSCCARALDFQTERIMKKKRSDRADGAVRPVRAVVREKPAPREVRFVNNGDGTVTDLKTRLMWCQADSYVRTGQCKNWKEAREYVESLDTGGYNDWRLPTVTELTRIFDKRSQVVSSSKAILHLDPVFNHGGITTFWSSESAADKDPGIGWRTVGEQEAHSKGRKDDIRCVSFTENGYVAVHDKKDCQNLGVRAVRIAK